jgi:hypothetical protein
VAKLQERAEAAKTGARAPPPAPPPAPEVPKPPWARLQKPKANATAKVDLRFQGNATAGVRPKPPWARLKPMGE